MLAGVHVSPSANASVRPFNFVLPVRSNIRTLRQFRRAWQYFLSTFYCLYEDTWHGRVQFHTLSISILKYLFPVNFKTSSCIEFYEKKNKTKQNRNVIRWMPNLLIFYSIAGKLQNRTSTVNHCWSHCLFPEEAWNAINQNN